MKAKESLVLRIVDPAGDVVSELRMSGPQLRLMDLQYGDRWERPIQVPEPGRYRLECEMDGTVVADAEVEARVRESVTVELEAGR